MSAAPANGEISVGSTSEEFIEELTYFYSNRLAIRRFMPTPDRFPFVCELVDAAKKYYVSLPRRQRDNRKYLPFFYFGREWFIRTEFVYAVRTDERYINICSGRTVLVTVPVLVVETWDSP